MVVPPPGPRSRERGERLHATECPAFAERRQARAGGDPFVPVCFERGRGANLFDLDGNRYVDLAAGFGAAILGHGPSPAHAAATAQIGKLVQGLGDLFPSEVKVALLERLAAWLPGTGARVLLGQSGADAVTIALKTAALATGRPGVLAFDGSYHGLSYGPLAACGFRSSLREPFAAQLNPHVRFVPYPRAQADETLALAAQALRAGDVGAVLVEPVLGRGGVRVPPPGFLAALAELSRSHGALLVADEIWTGVGRSGALLASRADGVEPDLVCVGKGLGASFPVSACVGTGAVMDAWARGGEVVHTSTHAGAPLGCAAALATLSALDDGALMARATRLGDELREHARVILAGAQGFVEARGRGLIVGIELASGKLAARVWNALLARGYVTTLGGPSGEVLVLTPALTIDREVLFGVVPVLAELCAEAR